MFWFFSSFVFLTQVVAVGQVPELLRFYEATGKDYLFVTMGRHTCYFAHQKHTNYRRSVEYLEKSLSDALLNCILCC